MRVAIVSYFTPPQPAIASHRVLRMTRTLIARGHDVHWVTADAGRFPPAVLDASLGDCVPASVRIHGIDGQALITKPVAGNLYEKIRRTLVWHAPRKFAWPDSFISFPRQLKRRLPGLLLQHDFDAILLCCSPHSQILALPRIRSAFPDLPIFVDYRDLLSGNPWNAPANPQVARRKLALERRMLANANVLFVNTESARTRFNEVVGSVPGLEVEVMRNAADYELADSIAHSYPAPVLGGEDADSTSTSTSTRGYPTVHLGFFGSVFPRRRLRPILDALAAIPSPDRQRFAVHVYCDAFDSARLLAEDLAAVPEDVSARVTRHDYLPYASALRAMQAMDALLLVNGPDASDALFVPGKLYDYLMARRPVLFVGHPGEAGSIVERACGGDWCFRATGGEAGGSLQSLAAKLVWLSRQPRLRDLAPVAEFGVDQAFAPLLALLARLS